MTKNKENVSAVTDLFSQIMLLSRRVQYSALKSFDDLGFESVGFRADDRLRLHIMVRLVHIQSRPCWNILINREWYSYADI